MIKVIPPDSWDFGQPTSALIRRASSGLAGRDLASLVKRAGHELADWVKHASPAPGEVWAHAIAMGAHESTGPNRNADTWYAEDLQKDAHTFESSAKVYRNHRNTSSDPHYGTIKRSYYNPDMRRVELILALFGTKAAAVRGGGKVADVELNMLEEDREIPGSMSTRIAFDQCLVCGNKAKTRASYCDEDSCPGGGMRKNAGLLLDDGRQVVVSNHGNRFFDYSRVFRPADRTAYVLGKVASHGPVVTGAELAENLGLITPAWLVERSDSLDLPAWPVSIKYARELSQARYEPSDLDLAFHPDVCPPLQLPQDLHDHKRVFALKALAAHGVALGLHDWLRLAAGVDLPASADAVVQAKQAWTFERPVFTNRTDLPEILREQALPTGPVPHELDLWAASQAEERTCKRAGIISRATLAALRGLSSNKTSVKSASDLSPASWQLAARYLAYQSAVLNFWENSCNRAQEDLTCESLVRQNRI